MVILPDYFTSNLIDPMASTREEILEFVKRETDWERTLKSTWETKIYPYAISNGAKTLGAIGKFFRQVDKKVLEKRTN